MQSNHLFQGLTQEQVLTSRKLHGRNIIRVKEDNVLLQVVKNVVLEPMFILLVIVAAIYFILQQYQEGTIMLTALIFVAGISLYQNFRSKQAIEELNKFNSSNPTVIRETVRQKISSEDVVVGDIILIEEGELISADGLILSSNDLTIDESILTGESFPVLKSGTTRDIVFKNTLVNSGSAVIEVNSVGRHTKVGQLGTLMKNVRSEKTSLQLKINQFLRSMIWFGVIAFLIVVIVKFLQTSNVIQSALQGLTMAMSVLPEEIAVAFSTFLALGSFRLIKHNIIVKHPQYLESLGSATVICLDKTGTITENAMQVAFLYDSVENKNVRSGDTGNLPSELLEYAMWSSETTPFDAMEKAIHALYEKTAPIDKRSLYTQIHEYPLSGNPPMMTHIFSSRNGYNIIAAKGAPEALFPQCSLSDVQLKRFSHQAADYAREGYRVIGVGKSSAYDPWPATQQELKFEFLGLIAFHDPPKKNIPEVLHAFDEAGINVKLVTGDFAETAAAIANQVNIRDSSIVITGKEVMIMSDYELQQKVKQINIYARMYPEAKLRLVNALKKNNEVVAMTGDGVNDAPALKAAHIGIAMGHKGSAVAKKAASLIITDDDLAHMIEAIALGRRIYDNLKKAIRYIISIHIPIIMIVSVPVLMYWKFAGIFTPVHVIFLELIMSPTCSIIYENEPLEPGTMQRKPLQINKAFLLRSQLALCIIQGIIASIVCLGLGFFYMQSGASENSVRTIIFITLLFCNILLTLENRSSAHSIIKTFFFKNRLMIFIIIVNIGLIITILSFSSVRNIFKLEILPPATLMACFLAAVFGTTWIEFWKYFVRKRQESKNYQLAI